MVRGAQWFLAAFAISCVGPGAQQDPGRDGDVGRYAAEVQPIVARRCAFLGCHGREGMPLTLYAVDYLRLRDPDGRLDSTRPALDERALSDGELDHNRRAIAARVAGDGGDTFVLRLLDPERGGIPHAGVVVYDAPDHPELDVLRRFFESVQ